MLPSRTLTLTERVPHLARLSPADVEALLARHRGHIDVGPTARRSRYRLTALGHVGVIVLPTRRLVVLPKIPLRNIFYMLAPETSLSAQPDAVTPADGAEVLDFLAGQFAQRLAERIAAGLRRGYAERADQGPYLLGRLDVPAQLREATGRKDQFHCRHDDFTPDVPHNQVPRAVLDLLLESPLLGPTVRAPLERLRPALEGIAPARLACVSPVPPDYAPLLELCHLLAEGLAPGASAGPTPAPAFLLDMEHVFERHVTRGVLEAFAGRPGWSVAVQPTHTVNRPLPGQPDIHVRPDVTIDRDGGPVVVVDAKWKRLPRTALVTDDLYQVLAYATALGVTQAVLVYPGRRRAWDYTFPRSSVRVTVRTLDVAGDRDHCERALRRMGKALRGPLTPQPSPTEKRGGWGVRGAGRDQ